MPASSSTPVVSAPGRKSNEPDGVPPPLRPSEFFGGAKVPSSVVAAPKSASTAEVKPAAKPGDDGATVIGSVSQAGPAAPTASDKTTLGWSFTSIGSESQASPAAPTASVKTTPGWSFTSPSAILPSISSPAPKQTAASAFSFGSSRQAAGPLASAQQPPAAHTTGASCPAVPSPSAFNSVAPLRQGFSFGDATLATPAWASPSQPTVGSSAFIRPTVRLPSGAPSPPVSLGTPTSQAQSSFDKPTSYTFGTFGGPSAASGQVKTAPWPPVRVGAKRDEDENEDGDNSIPSPVPSEEQKRKQREAEEEERRWDVSHIRIPQNGSEDAPKVIAVRDAPLDATPESLDRAELLERVRHICALENFCNTSVDEIRVQDYRDGRSGERPVSNRKEPFSMSDLAAPDRSLVVFNFRNPARQLYVPRYVLMRARPGRFATQSLDEAVRDITARLGSDPTEDDSDAELDSIAPYAHAHSTELDTSIPHRVEVTACRHATMVSVLAWLHTDQICFTKALRSSGDAQSRERRAFHELTPTAFKPVSPKSVWRLASQLRLPKLAAIALEAYSARLLQSNIAVEYFSIPPREDDLHSVAFKAICQHWPAIRDSASLREVLASRTASSSDALVKLVSHMTLPQRSVWSNIQSCN